MESAMFDQKLSHGRKESEVMEAGKWRVLTSSSFPSWGSH